MEAEENTKKVDESEPDVRVETNPTDSTPAGDEDQTEEVGKDATEEVEKDQTEEVEKDKAEEVEKDQTEEEEKDQTEELEKANDGDSQSEVEAVEKEPVLTAEFIDEDSVSRSSMNSKSARDETDTKESDTQDGQKSIPEEELSQDAGSIQSEVQMSVGKENEEMTVDDETNDSSSRQSAILGGEGDKEKDGEEVELAANETLNDDTDGEDLVAEVDISAMMEVNMDEDSPNAPIRENGDEPEVIALDDSDDETSGGKDAEAVVLNVDQSIYQIDEHENITEVDVSTMMEVNVEADEESQDSTSTTSTTSRRPRRAAAEAAAKTIHEISAAEKDVSSQVFRHRRKSQEDKEFDPDEIQEIEAPSTPAVKQNKCHICKKQAACSIVIRQYGADIHLCSNSCFNRFRNQGKDCKTKTLPCAKCGIMDENVNAVYYWETMNFCSDLCVGRYQMDVGSKCCTCGTSVSWTSLGKYCVRFGSDIRQFCTPQCLEGYKKNARVCFNCQLDIRRLGNVILANIAQKSTPKEFCSNECVEMYCDRNMHQPTRAKPVQVHACSNCHIRRPVSRDLILTNASYRSCSDACWTSLLADKGISKAEKCEMCAKFVNMDLGFTTPIYWLSSSSKIYGFCSHVCKNLYILGSRKILSCVTCKVKKYNYDLIEYFANSSSAYAVCSLACIPKSSTYLNNIREVIFLPQPAEAESIPVISAVSGSIDEAGANRPRRRRKQQHESVSTNANAEIVEIDDDDSDYEDFKDLEVKDSDNILDIFTIEELENILKLLRKPPLMDAACSAKPKLKTVETQTDISELNEMCRIPYFGEKSSITHKDKISHKSETKGVEARRKSSISLEKDSLKKDTNEVNGEQPTAKEKLNGDTDGKQSEEDHHSTSSKKEKDETESCSKMTTCSKPSVSKSTSRRNSSTSDNNEVPSSSISGSSSTMREASDKLHQPSSSVSKTPPRVDAPQLETHRVEAASSNVHSPVVEKSPFYSNQSSPAVVPSHLLPTSDYSPSPSSSSVASLASSYQAPPSSHPPSVAGAYSSQSSPVTPNVALNASSSMPPMVCPPVRPVAPIINYGASACVPPPQYPPSYPYNPSVVASGSSGISANFSNFPPSSASVINPNSSPIVPVGYNSSASPLGRMGAMTPPVVVPPLMPPSPTLKNPRVEYALRTWKNMFGPSSDPVYLSSMELSSKLCDLINRGCKPNGERFRADMLLYISLGIQQILRDNKRADKIFYDHAYYNYVIIFTDYAERELAVGIHATIEENHFWDASELGASSPGVMLFTLIYMFQKYFGLKTWEMQASLNFCHIVVQSRYDQFGRYVKYLSLVGLPGAYPTEIPEDINCPDRCLVKLYEFYYFKSEIRDGPFYKCLRSDYTPRSPWFTSQALDQRHIYQMLVRASMIKVGNNFS